MHLSPCSTMRTMISKGSACIRQDGPGYAAGTDIPPHLSGSQQRSLRLAHDTRHHGSGAVLLL